MLSIDESFYQTRKVYSQMKSFNYIVNLLHVGMRDYEEDSVK